MVLYLPDPYSDPDQGAPTQHTDPEHGFCTPDPYSDPDQGAPSQQSDPDEGALLPT
jgi:hypothetical protein